MAPRVAHRTQILATTEQAAVYNAAVSAETQSLLTAAEGPWTALSAEQKVGLYRAIYKTTRAENIKAIPNDTGFVAAGTLIGVAAGFGLFTLIGSLMINEENPSTTTGTGFNLVPNQATQDKCAERGLNPQKGYGSAEFQATQK
jgi:hypothetical protein